MSIKALVDQLNEAVTHLPGVQDVNMPELNNPFEFYGALILSMVEKARINDDGKALMSELANFYMVLGDSVNDLDDADRFQSQSSLELIGIARLAIDRPRLKQLIGTLIFADEMLDAVEAKQKAAAGA